MTRVLPAVCLLAFAAASLAAAYDTPEAAAKDPDFAVQGEYVGELTSAEGEKLTVGAQVIALGAGKFTLIPWEGGLPGTAGDLQRKDPVDSVTEDGKTLFKGAEHTGTYDSGVIHVTGAHTGDLKRVERTSDTLAKPAPAGATVLFDGTKESLANWKPGAKITDDMLLMQGVTSNATFGDCTVHVEFRLPFQPEARGQGRGNSGIYVQGRYEVQMLDSFGLKGEHNECGGIYNVAKPAVNMCYPPLAWQTYDIEFTAARYDDAGKKTASARITVHHNGVKIHDNVEIKSHTAAAPVKDGPEPGPVYLQDHGNPVRYRNIWVMPKAQ